MTGKLCCRNERAEEQSLFRRCPSLLSLTLMSVLLSPLSLQAADIRRSGEDTFIIQQQRQEALEQQLTPSAPDVRLSAPGSFAHKINFPVETPCFQIKQTELKGADALPHWLPLQKIANGAVGHCLGAKGINLLMSTLQNRLVDHGYVTTRVLAPSQDLKSGILRLVVIPGVVRHVRLTPDSDDYIQLYSSFPAHEGSLLDLRDIEQGLENMQRLPGVQADMEIVPGEQPGESDILITRKQDKYWRLGFSLDDSGTRSTGRYLGGITFSLDNPFSLSDLLYVSATHNFPHYGGTGHHSPVSLTGSTRQPSWRVRPGSVRHPGGQRFHSDDTVADVRSIFPLTRGQVIQGPRYHALSGGTAPVLQQYSHILYRLFLPVLCGSLSGHCSPVPAVQR